MGFTGNVGKDLRAISWSVSNRNGPSSTEPSFCCLKRASGSCRFCWWFFFFLETEAPEGWTKGIFMQIVFDMNDLSKPHSRFIRHLNHYRYIIQLNLSPFFRIWFLFPKKHILFPKRGFSDLSFSVWTDKGLQGPSWRFLPVSAQSCACLKDVKTQNSVTL